MGAKQGEKILVITDENKRNIGLSIYENAKKLGFESLFVEMKAREINGEEPPKYVADLMPKFEVVFCPTSKSLTHTNARRKASKRGSRIASLPGITLDTMIRGLNANYTKVAALTLKLKKHFERTTIAHVTAPNGTDITMNIAGRTVVPSKGLFHKKGESGNLPTGETFVAPVEGSANGVFVIDGSMAGIGMIKKNPITIVVENGLATEINGGPQAKKLKKMLEPYGKKGRNIAELGIGTNEKAKLSGLILEDEKVLGTAHIALGDNKSMGGSVNVPIHLDGVIMKPTISFDGKLIMKSGRLLV
jgi:leucyl aminopeptidase (aminopeptidase T)